MIDVFVIEKNVAIPPRERFGIFSKYPFSMMDVSDSFAVALTPEDRKKTLQNVRAAVYSYNNKNKHLNVHLICRVVTEEGKHKVRVWRDR